MAAQVLIRELGIGAPFMHVHDEGTKELQPERMFRVIARRASTVIVESGVGVRTSMAKTTRVLPVSTEQWAKLARPAIAQPIDTGAQKAGEAEKAAG